MHNLDFVLNNAAPWLTTKNLPNWSSHEQDSSDRLPSHTDEHFEHSRKLDRRIGTGHNQLAMMQIQVQITTEYEPAVNEVQVPVLNRELCNIWLEHRDLNVTERMICAGYAEGGKDACQCEKFQALLDSYDGGRGSMVVEAKDRPS
ncbi:hypothetical protein PR048_013491 [Dryococelus australis]|uniref:Peptidase S1 domain-containing protein n=1 Tax=Dryococelus australis TaxID=614101 RepID=A0ABQ9HSH3_9NEOP|nr:hypothetical protein PR048_013491 [Dryococelus australis]